MYLNVIFYWLTSFYPHSRARYSPMDKHKTTLYKHLCVKVFFLIFGRLFFWLSLNPSLITSLLIQWWARIIPKMISGQRSWHHTVYDNLNKVWLGKINCCNFNEIYSVWRHYAYNHYIFIFLIWMLMERKRGPSDECNECWHDSRSFGITTLNQWVRA